MVRTHGDMQAGKYKKRRATKKKGTTTKRKEDVPFLKQPHYSNPNLAAHFPNVTINSRSEVCVRLHLMGGEYRASNDGGHAVIARNGEREIVRERECERSVE